MQNPLTQQTGSVDLDTWLFRPSTRTLADAPESAVTETPQSVRLRDGFSLATTVFEPSTQPSRAVVLIAAAMGVRQRYYFAFARHLAAHGLTAITFDYRGVGRSRPKRLQGFSATLGGWGENDLAEMIDHVHARANGLPVLYVGHSVGGQLMGIARNNDRIHASAFIGSQRGELRHWDVAGRARIGLYFRALVPAFTTAMGYMPGGLLGGEDLPAGVAREWREWCLREGHIVGGNDASRREIFRQFRGPLLSVSFEDDDFAPRAAVEALLDLYETARISRRHILPSELGLRAIGHFGFFSRKMETLLWPTVTEWLLQQIDCFPTVQ